MPRTSHIALSLIVALAAGCNDGTRVEKKDAKSTATNGGTTTAPSTSNGAAGNGGLNLGSASGTTTPTGSLDPDHDGLTNDEEALFGTDPNNPDTDGDGIIDGRDLAPLFGAAAYGPFDTQYPRGTVHTEQDYAVTGLEGRSKIEKWLAGWRKTYEGTTGTRSSVVTDAKVKAELDKMTAQSEFDAVKAAPKAGAETTWGSKRYEKTFFPSRYTIDYDYTERSYSVDFRNGRAVTMRDKDGRALASRTFPVTVQGGAESTVILQFSIDAGADRYQQTATGYTVPTVTFQVFAGQDPYTAQVLRDDVAVGQPLNDHAFEVRMPMPAAAGNAPAQWTVVVTPLWTTKQGSAKATVEAIDAGVLRIGAAAHDQAVASGNTQTQRTTGIFAELRDLATDLRAASAQASFGQQVIDQKTVITRNQPAAGRPTTAQDWTLSIVRTVAAISRTAISTLIQVDEFVSYSSGADLAGLMNAADAARYKEIIEQLQRVQNASNAVVHGLQAVVMAQNGDTIRATLYTARSLTEAFRAVGDSELIRAGAAVVAGVSDIYEAYDAFRKGDHLNGGLYVIRATVDVLTLFNSEAALAGTAVLGAASEGINAYNAFKQGNEVLGLVHVARGSGALARFFLRGQEIMGIPAGSVITAALGVVDVAYNVYQATQHSDPIIKQRYIEDAFASALDTAIFLIPTVGPAIEVIWQVAYQALSWIFPDLAKFRMLRSPGALLTFVGQVFFTNTIPSAYAEDAYEAAAKDFIAKLTDRQNAGERVIAIFPDIK
ncbi:MAG: hypothetical protein AB7N76_31440 [Planctomycetota bacterium]